MAVDGGRWSGTTVGSMRATLPRRVVSVTTVVLVAGVLTASLPIWFVLCTLLDVIRRRRHRPLTRLFTFACGWAWLEVAGTSIALWWWARRRTADRRRHYALQRWWATNLMSVLRRTTGITVDVDGLGALAPGRAIMLCRHASIADSLVSAWVVTSLAGKNPRYVLKRELRADPCLDIVGARLPNHFVDREARDSTAELKALTALTAVDGGLGTDDIAVIYPEGTLTSPARRSRLLGKLAERDPERAGRLGGLQHLLPPRPAGSLAMLRGDPSADVVLAWHVGFDGLQSLGGMVHHLSHRPPPARFVMHRVPRGEVPDDGAAFTRWLDERWLRMDAEVTALLDSGSRPD